MKIAVLMGGISGERNVSFTSGRSVFNALKNKGHEVIAVDPALGSNSIIDIENLEIENRTPSDEDLGKFNVSSYLECIKSDFWDNIDCAFNMVHGIWGEDGHLQALLDMKGLKQTGSGIRACSIAMDKIATKMLLTAGGVPTPEWGAVPRDKADDLDFLKDLRKELGKELVFKPYDQGSALGLTIVKNGDLDEMAEGIRKAGKYSNAVLVEEFIEGREITVTVIDNQSYPIVEIKPKEGFYDYKNKYTKGMTEYICPADIDEYNTEFIQDLALSAHRLVGCKGFSRVDFRLNDENQPFCLEINTIPGFTELSLLPMAAKVGGLEFDELCEKLVQLAVK